VRSTFWAILANVALNIALLPRIGISGAALATLLSFGLQVYLTGREALHEMKIDIDIASVFRFCAAATVIILVGTQLRFDNIWLEAGARTAMALLYFPAILFLDRKLRDTAIRVATPYVQHLHRV
jgi:O-antigen/teichoic acid export membrane protein